MTSDELKGKIRKTGTTTVGIICKEGIILAADKRGTYGGEGGVSYIASGDEEKIQSVTDNIVVTTAGVASDLQKIIKLTQAEIKLKELRSKQKTTIREAVSLFSNLVYQNIRQLSPILGIAHFLLAGYDYEGFHFYEIHPDGYFDEIKRYASTGSGSFQCNPILDSEYKKDMTIQQGIDLAKKCVNAAMKRDPATGEGIEIYTVTRNQIKQILKQKTRIEFEESE